ncbi:MAG: RsmD family RNA methyltransferase [Ignavibacteria bacterium]
MRIISGYLGGRIIKSPRGLDKHLRPTTDKARESLFNILSHRMNLEGLQCIDLFCGTGSLGLECISRGASRCTFVDTYTQLVYENIKSLNLNDKCEIIKDEVFRFLQKNKQHYHLGFADPPYHFQHYKELISLAAIYIDFFILEHNLPIIELSIYEDKIVMQRIIGKSRFTFINFKE